MRSQLLGGAGALVLLVAAPAGARAATLVERTVEATGAHATSCQVRALGLTRPRSGRVVVGRGSGGREFHGTRRFDVRFTTAARRRLRGVRRLRLRLRASAAAGRTDRRSVTRTVVLRRGATDPPT